MFFVHAYSGDFIVIDGSAITGTITGSGGILRGIGLLNKAGSPGSSNGVAVKITGADTTNRATWQRLIDVEINKYNSSYGEFTYGVDIDGSSLSGEYIRDIFIERCRIAADTGASGAIRILKGANIFISDTSCNLAKGDIVVTGADASNKSSGVRISNCYGNAVVVDFANEVHVSGGNWTSLSSTTNSTSVVFRPNRASFIDNKAAYGLYYSSRWTFVNDNANTFAVSRDLDAGDSTNTAQFVVGNANIGQGGAYITYKNDDPLSGTQEASFYLKGRNSSDTGEANMAYIRMNQIAGTDSAQMQFFCGTDRRIYLFQQGNHTVQFKGNLTPETDNSYNVGNSGLRWGTIYAATGTINTSDEREKTEILPLSSAEKAAALEIKNALGSFRFKDAVEKKGGKARTHFGAGAQTVASILRKHGLDPDQYAFFCYDEWEEVTDEDGNVIVEAGSRYGLRYEELMCFILAAL